MDSKRPLIEQGEIPTKVYSYYKEAVNCFNSGCWRATVSQCSFSLKKIAEKEIPEQESEDGLYYALYNLQSGLKIINYLSLLEPILLLCNSLRLGKNPSNCFDLEKEPDREAAEKILYLTEYLIQYLYVLPYKVGDLESVIESLGGKGLGGS